MKINKNTLDSTTPHNTHIANIKFAYRHQLLLNGLPYDDEIVSPDGIHLTLYVPLGTSKEECEKAIREGYNSRDVVKHTTLECPAEWFEKAKGM